MKFKTHNTDPTINSNGTCLQSYVKTTYASLVALFGQPHGSDGYKVDAEWDIQFEDGTVATIYNYKDGPNYNQGGGTPVEEITDWHIGGHDKNAVLRLLELGDIRELTN